MPLRPLMLRLMLCLAFVLSSSYVQAMAHVDEMGSASKFQVAKAKLPPCHKVMPDGNSDPDGGHHGACCSNFACALGLTVEDALTPLPHPQQIRSVEYVPASRSVVRQPLDPPPKTI
jgi:hypothetical protein